MKKYKEIKKLLKLKIINGVSKFYILWITTAITVITCNQAVAQQQQGREYIFVNSFSTEKKAKENVLKLQKENYSSSKIVYSPDQNVYRVSIADYATKGEANRMKEKLIGEGKIAQAWVGNNNGISPINVLKPKEEFYSDYDVNDDWNDVDDERETTQQATSNSFLSPSSLSSLELSLKKEEIVTENDDELEGQNEMKPSENQSGVVSNKKYIYKKSLALEADFITRYELVKNGQMHFGHALRGVYHILPYVDISQEYQLTFHDPNTFNLRVYSGYSCLVFSSMEGANTFQLGVGQKIGYSYFQRKESTLQLHDGVGATFQSVPPESIHAFATDVIISGEYFFGQQNKFGAKLNIGFSLDAAFSQNKYVCYLVGGAGLVYNFR